MRSFELKIYDELNKLNIPNDMVNLINSFLVIKSPLNREKIKNIKRTRPLSEGRAKTTTRAAPASDGSYYIAVHCGYTKILKCSWY